MKNKFICIISVILSLIIVFIFVLYILGSYRYIKIINCSNEAVNIELNFRDKLLFKENIKNRFIESKFLRIDNDGSYELKINNRDAENFSYDMAGIGFEFKLKTYYIIISPNKEIFMSDFQNKLD